MAYADADIRGTAIGKVEFPEDTPDFGEIRMDKVEKSDPTDPVDTADNGPVTDRVMFGIGLIVVAMLSMSILDAVAKHLVASYPVIQMLSLRGLVIITILLVLMPRSGGLSTFRTANLAGQIRRIGYSLAAPVLFFTALKDLPLADVTVLVFGGSFFMTALSVPILGERVGIFRWSAIAIGFTGVVIAAEPTGDSFGMTTLFAVSASVAYALLMIETRRTGFQDSIFTQTLYPAIGVTFIAWLATPFVWVPVDQADYIWIALLGVFALAGHYLIYKAFSLAPVSVLAPFEYTALVWATLFGFFIFGELPGAQVWLGAAIIVVSGIIIVWREATLSRSKHPTQPTVGD
jgi:drug/metabolite transporter (DMT)-like permease